MAMIVDEKQIESVIEKLKGYSNPPKPCPICGKNGWNVLDTIFEIREFNGANKNQEGESRVIPFVVMSCANCSNSVFLNAIHLGIVAPDPKVSTENEGGKE
jgi:hypothetical protein